MLKNDRKQTEQSGMGAVVPSSIDVRVVEEILESMYMVLSVLKENPEEEMAEMGLHNVPGRSANAPCADRHLV